MSKLYFKYGAMGSSKSAQVLITKFNYEEKGLKVWLIKPDIDKRDSADKIVSRIGLAQTCDPIGREVDLYREFSEGHYEADVIIADECQFFTEAQIDELRLIVDEFDTPVLCFGLKTDFMTRLFEGSRRLLEVADSISEIKTICECGCKANVNARIAADGQVITEGEQVVLGGNESYTAMCHRCWMKKIKSKKAAEGRQ